MSATRLLVLGVVRGFGRAHGYLVRAQLVTWGAQDWANIRWGSLYHALRKLTADDLLTAAEDGRGRVDYEITARGEAEFFRLLRSALSEPAPRPDMLAAGLSLLPALGRAEAVELLRARQRILRATQDEIPGRIPTGSPHVRELYGLWAQNTAGNLAWTQQVIDRLEAGKYVMADEPGARFGIAGAWSPPAE
ncbi:transcriptional regulator [Actinosynnema sp. ALI-1.44]|uniref:PadR family transcriptional regulator n=1 Tax=Actinosynnema sp. ALI-1.44 TaxID=1933779 RepID=UPI00097BC303|nr:helix-turn-helix transcriptional regulator [Actinosynnema sp. ALI-1.44]ONI79870.1 transcriptional regulator [Actinosynnema sp. ALI-1.44]